MSDRQDWINGLRELADYMEARPELPTPYGNNFHVFPDPAKLAAVARTMRGLEKDHDREFLILVKEFSGNVRLEVCFSAKDVCERIVVGTREVPEKVIPAHVEEDVEWKCPPVLAGTESL